MSKASEIMVGVQETWQRKVDTCTLALTHEHFMNPQTLYSEKKAEVLRSIGFTFSCKSLVTGMTEMAYLIALFKEHEKEKMKGGI